MWRSFLKIKKHRTDRLNKIVHLHTEDMKCAFRVEKKNKTNT